MADAVIGPFRLPCALRRHVLMTLATLALALQIMIPPGFMADATTAGPTGFALVVCTGQAADLDDTTPGEPAKAADAPCLFVSHGAGGPAPTAPLSAEASPPAAAAPIAALAQGPAPGARLIGPPMPPRGPPQRRS